MIWAEQHNLYGVKLIIRGTIRGFRSRNLRNPELGAGHARCFQRYRLKQLVIFSLPHYRNVRKSLQRQGRNQRRGPPRLWN
jgi:hypothetical protein